MADEDLTILDENKPNGAIEEVAVLDDYQRETRTKLKAWAGKEHDLTTGAHNIVHAPTLIGGYEDGRMMYHETARELLVDSGGAWRSVAQPTFNYIINGVFNQFYTNPVMTFVGWNLYGAGAVIDIFGPGSGSYGSNTARLIAGTAPAVLYQTVAANTNTTAPFSPYTYWRGKTVTFGVLIRCDVTDVAYIQLHDGISYTAGAYHPGDGKFHWMTVTKVIAGNATKLQVEIVSVKLGQYTVISGATLVEGHSCIHPLPQGWQGRQGVLHFGSPDAQPNTNIIWFYSTSGHSLGIGAPNYIPFDAYVHDLRVDAMAQISIGASYMAQVDFNGVPTPVFVSIYYPFSNGSDLMNYYMGAKGYPWSVRVTRNGGPVAQSFGSLLYDEVPSMPP